MDFQELWDKARQQTDIVRARVQGLSTFDTTHLPYIFISKSQDTVGQTPVKQGEVLANKPMLILPDNAFHFEGFDFQETFQVNEQTIANFLLVRGITFPSLQYNNKTNSNEVFQGSSTKAVEHYLDILQRKEDVHTGLIVGPDDCWQFSVLIFICLMVSKSATSDLRKILEKYKQ